MRGNNKVNLTLIINMKREVKRKKKLPSFAIDIGELEVLWNKLYSLFDTQDLHGSIHVEFPLEKIKFENIDKLKKYNGLPDKITSFSISVSDFCSPSGCRMVSVDSNSFSFFSENSMVYASAESEAWCAGAI